MVEIDETAVSKWKFNCGRRVSTLWCVGGICRTHKSFFFVLTTKISRDILHEIILKNVETTTKIITDEWKGYLGLDPKIASHESICHKKHFIDPKFHYKHTQNTE